MAPPARPPASAAQGGEQDMFHFDVYRMANRFARKNAIVVILLCPMSRVN
jgi:hypothetical protein